MHSISASYYDGQSSKCQAVTVSLTDTLLCIKSDVELNQFEKDECQLSLQPGAEYYRLQLPNNQLLLIPNNPDTADLKRHFSLSGQVISKLERQWWMVAVSVIFTFVFGYWSIQHGLPLASDSLAPHIPADVMDGPSQNALNSIIDDPDQRSQLPVERKEALVARFYQVLQDVKPEHQYSVHFIHGGEKFGANALALPSGDIIFTDELISLMESDNEIVAVFLHEMGHVEQRHTLRNLLKQVGLLVITTLVFGDATEVTGFLSTTAIGIMQLSYSREYEMEADQYATNTAHKARIAPNDFKKALIRLHDEKGGSPSHSYLSTHPSLEQRIHAIPAQ